MYVKQNYSNIVGAYSIYIIIAWRETFGSIISRKSFSTQMHDILSQ